MSTLTPDTWPYDAAVYGRLGLGAHPARADPEGRLPAETLSASELKATFAAMGFGTVR